MGVLLTGTGLSLPDASLAIFATALGLFALALGVRIAYAFAVYVRPPDLVVRFAYRTRRVSLGDIERVEPTVGSEGLVSRRAYPTVALKDRTTMPCNVIQWRAEDRVAAEMACEVLTDAVREGT